MADLDDLLGIDAGDSTEIRDITAPGLGDEYLDSYYDILAAAEKNTIHFAETQADLPTGNYDVLVGVAETVRGGSSQLTLHFYNGTEWFDTFDSEIITKIEDDIDAVEDDIGGWNPTSDKKQTIAATLGNVSAGESDLATRVQTNEDNIGNVGSTDLQTQIDNIEDDIGSVGDTDLQTQINNNNKDISSIEEDIGSVGDTDLQTQINNNDGDISNIEEDIGSVGDTDLQTQINNNNDDISSIEDDVGDIAYWEDDLKTQIDNNDDDISDIEDDIGNVPYWEDDLQTQINDLEDNVGGVKGVSDLQGGNVYVGRIKADDLDEDMYDGRNGTVTWDLEDEVFGFDSSNTLVSATVETQPWTSIEHYYGGCITTSAYSSGSVSAFFILNWDSEVKVSISYLYY